MNQLSEYQVTLLEHAANSESPVCLLMCMEGDVELDGQEIADRKNKELVAHAQLIEFGLAVQAKKVPWEIKRGLRKQYGRRRAYFIVLTHATVLMFRRQIDFKGESTRRTLEASI